MFILLKYHLKKLLFILFFIFIGCQLKEPNKNHGILFLENRAAKLVYDTTNQNDVIKIFGQPHSKSIDDENMWIYIERTLGKGKYHRLGRHILVANNVLVLSFNKYGVLKRKDFYSKDDLKKVAFSNKVTQNELTKKSFVESFFSSVREKMYGGRR
jgi:outer membrane protein assembly factor BamE (lipoprotein component of BamABCDE complex)